MVSFADVQDYIHADNVGGVQKGQEYADVIQGWSLGTNNKLVCSRKTSVNYLFRENVVY